MFGRSDRHDAMRRCARISSATGAFRSGAIVDFARAFHGVEIAVHPQQQPDQGFPLRLVQAGQQPAFAFERDRDDLVVGGVSLRGQRDRVGAAVLPVGPDR